MAKAEAHGVVPITAPGPDRYGVRALGSAPLPYVLLLAAPAGGLSTGATALQGTGLDLSAQN